MTGTMPRSSRSFRNQSASKALSASKCPAHRSRTNVSVSRRSCAYRPGEHKVKPVQGIFRDCRGMWRRSNRMRLKELGRQASKNCMTLPAPVSDRDIGFRILAAKQILSGSGRRKSVARVFEESSDFVEFEGVAKPDACLTAQARAKRRSKYANSPTRGALRPKTPIAGAFYDNCGLKPVNCGKFARTCYQ